MRDLGRWLLVIGIGLAGLILGYRFADGAPSGRPSPIDPIDLDVSDGGSSDLPPRIGDDRIVPTPTVEPPALTSTTSPPAETPAPTMPPPPQPAAPTPTPLLPAPGAATTIVAAPAPQPPEPAPAPQPPGDDDDDDGDDGDGDDGIDD